jgi:hypothetical protein
VKNSGHSSIRVGSEEGVGEMAKPIAICIEDLDSTKYIRCVALPGRQPGLRLDEAGKVLWQSHDGVTCELWVSADERLVLYRPEGKTPVKLRRAGRSLDVPCNKPVIIVDKDQVDVGPHHLRVHIHGEASSVVAPSVIASRPRSSNRLAQAIATAAVVGAVAATGGCTDVIVPPTIEVIDNPPEPPEPTPEITVEEVIQGEWVAAQAYDVGDERIWISGTLTIEGGWYAFEPAREITGTSVQGVLDFLFDAPSGEVTIEYAGGWAGDDFEYYAPGDELGTCAFYVDSEVVGEFLIMVGDTDNLIFHSQSSEISLWSIEKQLGADTEQ